MAQHGIGVGTQAAEALDRLRVEVDLASPPPPRVAKQATQAPQMGPLTHREVRRGPGKRDSARERSRGRCEFSSMRKRTTCALRTWEGCASTSRHPTLCVVRLMSRIGALAAQQAPRHCWRVRQPRRSVSWTPARSDCAVCVLRPHRTPQQARMFGGSVDARPASRSPAQRYRRLGIGLAPLAP